VLKKKLRKKILKIREIYNQKNIKIDFNKIINFFKKENITKKNIGGYFPVNFEVDDLDLLKNFEKNNYKISLPVIKKNFIWIFINGHFLIL
jgi:5-formyltetrahydrofolate cyclo-ligase